MLTRLRGLVVLTVVAAATVLSAPMAAQADPGTGGVQCTKNDPRPACNVNAGTGGQTGGNQNAGNNTGGKGGDGKCRKPSGEEIPCERDGAYAGSDGCYYAPTDPSPSSIEALGGQPAGAGGWYIRTCYGANEGFGGIVWMAGGPPVISPAVLARQARARLELPEARVSLSPAGRQLTHFPTWLTVEPSSWQPRSATASVPGVSVTATARPTKATWSMGDHSVGRSQGVVVCAGPGTKFRTGMDPAQPSPDCGYTYGFPSAGAPGEKFTVTVTITWEVTWAGAGQSGTVPDLTTTGSVQVPVQESHALVS
jgi:hypothetical protein